MDLPVCPCAIRSLEMVPCARQTPSPRCAYRRCLLSASGHHKAVARPLAGTDRSNASKSHNATNAFSSCPNATVPRLWSITKMGDIHCRQRLSRLPRLQSFGLVVQFEWLSAITAISYPATLSFSVHLYISN
jgi:hypothetical protein